MGTVAPDKLQVLEQSRGRWHGILSGLGIDAVHLTGKHSPCPMCGGKDRFRFTNHRDEGGYVCNGCGNGSGLDLLMKYQGWDFPTALSEVAGVVGACSTTGYREAKKRDARQLLRRIAKGAKPITATDPASVYLKARGLSTLPEALRWHPGLGYFEDGKRVGTYPALLARMVDPTGKPLTFHVTYVQAGVKAPVGSPRKIMPAVAPIKGGAVRLFPQVAHIGIAEGIETAIAAHERSGLPVWAALNTSGLKAFEPPAGIEAVSIFADNDRHFAGQSAAYHLAHRLAIGGISVRVEVPPEPGTDFLDVLNSRERAA